MHSNDEQLRFAQAAAIDRMSGVLDYQRVGRRSRRRLRANARCGQQRDDHERR